MNYLGQGTIGAIGLAAVGISLASSLFNVEPGNNAILFNSVTGVRPHVYPEGTHFKIPLLESVITYNIRPHPEVFTSMTGTKDLQMVNVSVRVLCKPSAPELPTLYRTLGTDYDKRVLPSIVNEIVKSAVAQSDAFQLVTQREQVSKSIRVNLINRARDFNILIDDVSITNLGFGNEFNSAIESKQIAQQDAERAKYVVKTAEQEKFAMIIKAKGEAKSAELMSKVGPAYIKLRKMEVAQEIATIISGSRNKVLLDSNSLMLNLKDLLNS